MKYIAKKLKLFVLAFLKPRKYSKVTQDWQEFWNEKALSDDSSAASGRPGLEPQIFQFIAQDIKLKLKLGGRDSVLDIGCNLGDITALISDDVHDITGIDISENAIQSAQKKYGNQNIIFLNEELPVHANRGRRYDAVIVYSVLHYLKWKTAAKKFLDNVTSI
ncbi:MAG: methyltransferase domain-containing protein, partial [Nitrospiraceae bacterium]|nr:methyltransferase domain-containing protein [Nitrospiraceae bacterium]